MPLEKQRHPKVVQQQEAQKTSYESDYRCKLLGYHIPLVKQIGVLGTLVFVGWCRCGSSVNRIDSLLVLHWNYGCPAPVCFVQDRLIGAFLSLVSCASCFDDL